jgi:hypothetical protein
MSNPSFSANQELADHQLDMQAGSDKADIASKRQSGKAIVIGNMTPEELENFKRQRAEEERRDSPWGQLFT